MSSSITGHGEFPGTHHRAAARGDDRHRRGAYSTEARAPLSGGFEGASALQDERKLGGLGEESNWLPPRTGWKSWEWGEAVMGPTLYLVSQAAKCGSFSIWMGING